MGVRKHGITSTTYQNIMIDSGEVRKDFVSWAQPGTILGATRGGSSFVVEPEIKNVAVDGAKGPVKGGRRIVKVNAKLTINFIEWKDDLIKIMNAGSAVTKEAGKSTIKRELQITNNDYINNIAIIGQISGYNNPAVLIVKNVLCVSPFEVSLVDGEEAVVKAEFEGHFDPTDLDKEPWEIITVNDQT